MKTKLAVYIAVLGAVLWCTACTLGKDTPPYDGSWTYAAPDFLVAGSDALAGEDNGFLGLFATSAGLGGASVIATQRLLVTVEAPTWVTVEFQYRWQGGCSNLGLTPTSWSGTRFVWYVDGAAAGTQDIDPLFRFGDMVSKALSLVTAGIGASGVKDIPELLAFLSVMKASVLLNNVLPLVDAKTDRATFKFWATGTHVIHVGVQAGVSSAGISVGQALLFGVLSEIEVTALNPAASIEIIGPSSVDERSSADFACAVRFREGPPVDVTRSASCNWQVDRSTVVVAGPGKLSVGSLTSDESCTLTVTYTSWITSDTGHKFTASMPLTLVNRSGALSGMSLIPAGSFQMGDGFGEGLPSEMPVHTVYVSAFHMDKCEVTKALWDEVAAWAQVNGYDLKTADGAGKAAEHPVTDVTWYESVKWANARSEKEGFTPCYYTDSSHRTAYRAGNLDLSSACVEWTASGYRLPTEAEWERAARGGAAGQRFPWSDADTIDHTRANYSSDTRYSYDTSPTRGFHPIYAMGELPYTSPVGSFVPNGYGLYDMAGNVDEWCWDWERRDSTYYNSSPGTDPRGLASGAFRVSRGGTWGEAAYYCRVAYRNAYTPDFEVYYRGFRLVRTAP